MKRKIAPAILIVACLLLGIFAFRRLQFQAMRQNLTPPTVPGMIAAPGSPATPAERAEAISSIVAQLDAFRRGDYEKASYFQSPMLRMSIGSTERFRSMMANQYPEFANSAHAAFGEARSMMDGEQIVVPVAVTGKDGITVQAVYTMERSPDGIYRVIGVSGGQR